MKTKITEEQKVHEQWYEEAKKQTTTTLPDFINHLMNDYEHDYGTCCHAIAAGAIATSWAMNGVLNITGFQAGAVMWEYIQHWQYTSNKTGLKMIDYDYLLYPQYESHFDKQISAKKFELLQKEAKFLLSNPGGVEKVRAHWQSIVDGVIPFGYTIKKEDHYG